jgi:hypothetical protein
MANGRAPRRTMKRIRDFFESIAFAGLRPGQKPGTKKARWFGSAGEAVDRLISGSAPSDPLYLSNRSSGQKMKLWILIGAPCLLLAMAVGVALSNILDREEPKPVEPATREVSANLLPDLASTLSPNQQHDLEVVEVRVEHTGGSHVNGVVRNTTGHDIATAHVVMDLTDINGSQVGGVEANLEKIPAMKTKTFSIPIAQRTAAIVLVREATPIH